MKIEKKEKHKFHFFTSNIKENIKELQAKYIEIKNFLYGEICTHKKSIGELEREVNIIKANVTELRNKILTLENQIQWLNYDYCLNAVKYDPFSLFNVVNQTEEICLTAVKNNGIVLQYVIEQNFKIILEAVNQTIHARTYIKWDRLTQEEKEYIKLKFNIQYPT